MINGVTSVALEHVRPVESLTATPAGSEFAEHLRDAISSVERSGLEAATAAERFLSGNGNGSDIHSTALAAQKAALHFEYVLQVRNKVVQAYQEIMRMQL